MLWAIAVENIVDLEPIDLCPGPGLPVGTSEPVGRPLHVYRSHLPPPGPRSRKDVS